MRAREHFTTLVERDSPEPSLGELALWIAAEEYPDLNVAAYLDRFDFLAERVRRLGQRLGLQSAELLRVVLAEEQGFHGNLEQYTDPRNSFLNDVLDRRSGIPISLSIVYLEVARRAGIHSAGIGFPGHFLLQVGEGESAVTVDPFHGGRILRSEDCEALLALLSGGGIVYNPSLLEPTPWRKIIYRVLANLKNIYLAPPQDEQRALAVIERMLLVHPDSNDDLRDRALLLYQMGGDKG